MFLHEPLKQIMSTIFYISPHFIDIVLIIYPTHVVCVLQTLVQVHGCYNTLLSIQVTLKAYTDAIYAA